MGGPARASSWPRRRWSAALLCLLLAAETQVAGAAPGDVTRVPSGVQPNEESRNPSLSAGGRYVVFDSAASNLVALDLNGQYDVFLYDRQSQAIERISVSSSEAAANGHNATNYSAAPVVSDDGAAVTFSSDATNLVASDTNGLTDVFVRDRATGTTARASVSTTGTQADGPSLDPSLSGDGQIVAFESQASNLVAGDTNGASDVFVRDRQAGTTTRVSIATGGAQADGPSYFAATAGNGRFITFYSHATNLVAGDTNAAPDVFVHDRQAGTTTRVSVGSTGAQGNGDSVNPTISADGRFVAFESQASNLVSGDTNNVADVFVRDTVASKILRASVGSAGEQADAASSQPVIAADGSTVVFWSDATTLTPGDTNGFSDVFARSLAASDTQRVSKTGSSQANGDSFTAGVASGGAFVAFESLASNLTAGDSNGVSDVFVAEIDPAEPPTPEITSPPEGSATADPLVPVTGKAQSNAEVRVFEGTTEIGSATANGSGTWSVSIPFDEGSHQITARALDAVGNLGPPSAPRTFTVDLTAPAPPVIAVPAQGASVGAGSIRFEGTAEPGSTVTVFEGTTTLGPGVTSGSGVWSITATITVKGMHTVGARATDPAGNVGSSSAPRSFDVTTAVPVIEGPPDGWFTSNPTVTIHGSAEPGAVVAVYEGSTLRGTDVAEGGNWTMPATFPEGPHAVTATATLDGATSPASPVHAFTVDHTAPAAPMIVAPADDEEVLSASVTIAGDAEPFATVRVEEGTTPLGSTQASGSGAWSLGASLSSGTHTVRAIAMDRAGNEGPPSASRSFSVAQPASIVEPAEGSFQPRDVIVTGVSQADEMRVYEAGQELRRGPVRGGTWSITVRLDGGEHAIVVRGVSGGVLGPPSAPRSFVVDQWVPQVTFTRSTPGSIIEVVAPGGVIRGTAEDARTFDSGVARVMMKYIDLMGTTVAEAEATCGGCSAGHVTWEQMPPVSPGWYTVYSRAFDEVGNSAARTMTVVVI